MKHLFKNTTSSKLLVFFFLAIIPALALVFVSPLWLGDDTKTHAAPRQSMTQQGPPPTPTISQGVSAHGVSAWEHDGYTGNTIKIGILDRDFKPGLAGMRYRWGSLGCFRNAPLNVSPRCVESAKKCSTVLGAHWTLHDRGRSFSGNGSAVIWTVPGI